MTFRKRLLLIIAAIVGLVKGKLFSAECGQSNDNGFDAIPSAGELLDPWFSDPVPNTNIVLNNLSYVPLEYGVSQKSDALNVSSSNLKFAYDAQQKYEAVGMVKYAVNSSSLFLDWGEGSVNILALIAQINEGKTKETFTKNVMFNQMGEQDAFLWPTNPEFATGWADEFKSRMEYVEVETGIVFDTVIMVKLNTSIKPGSFNPLAIAALNDSIDVLVAADSKYKALDGNDYELQNDDLHYTTKGYNDIGTARALLS